jgi:hypothetical protein
MTDGGAGTPLFGDPQQELVKIHSKSWLIGTPNSFASSRTRILPVTRSTTYSVKTRGKAQPEIATMTDNVVRGKRKSTKRPTK